MDLKFFLKTFFLAFIVFSVAVVLGMKYNWVRFLPPNLDTSSNQQSVEEDTTPSTIIKKTTIQVGNYELVDETDSVLSIDQQVRNDCIRASRQAGVTDKNIFSVVNQCVEMSSKEHYPSDAQPDIDNSETVVEKALELTRKACRIVADEEQGMTEVERTQLVEQCINANMDN